MNALKAAIQQACPFHRTLISSTQLSISFLMKDVYISNMTCNLTLSGAQLAIQIKHF